MNGRSHPSTVRAILDDPPIRIRPNLPAHARAAPRAESGGAPPPAAEASLATPRKSSRTPEIVERTAKIDRGRPVRVQGCGTRATAGTPRATSIQRASAPIDKDGAVIGYVFDSKGFSRIDIDTNESDPAYSLAGQLMGLPPKSLQSFGVPSASYGFASKRLAWETIAPSLDPASPFVDRASPRPGRPADPVRQRKLYRRDSAPRWVPTLWRSVCII